MYQKTQRLVELTEKFQQELNLGDDIKEDLARASYLAKADLVTKMVIEFTELQGTMGKIYAKASGEDERVANAIEEQYKPKSANDDLPESMVGIVLSLADKMDSIVGLYAIEKYVTGSQDPFALRRAALGLINIILANNINVDLKALVNDALIVYTEKNGLPFDYDQTMQKTLDFIKDRLKNMLIDEGYRYDVVNAVINTSDSNILKIDQKVKAVSDFIKDNDEDLAYFTRIINLTKNSNDTNIDTNLLENDLEKEFYEEIANLPENGLATSDDYKKELELIAKTGSIGNNYLDNTMINVEDEALKSTRLAMLNILAKRIKKVFDVNEIVR